MENKLDLFFIILFVTVVSIIIGLNIVAVIDKKISNVSVNIPPINVPQPKLILNIDKKLSGRTDFSLQKAESNDDEEDEDKDKKKNEDIENNGSDQEIEGFIVSDANDFKRYKELRKKATDKSNSFHESNINSPVKDKIVDYDKKKNEDEFAIQLNYPDHTPEAKPKKYKPVRNNKSFITSADFGMDDPRQTVGCANSSISKKWKFGENSLVPNRIACNQPNKLTAENYYKTLYKPIAIPMEDVKVRGYNYAEYSDAVMPEKSDIRILSRTTKGVNSDQNTYNLLDGFNYGFHNSPAMPMP